MKVHDFAKRLGLPDSKVRYYDRAGLIRGGRQKENNYRDLIDQDALNIYHAQMLRSFGMGVREALDAQSQELAVIDGWVEKYAAELEQRIAWEEMRLIRLREMRAYFSMIQTRRDKLGRSERDASFNLYNFGKVKPLSPGEREAIRLLSQSMPFSYIAIRISRESLTSPGDGLDVSIGLGILERTRYKLGLSLPQSALTPGSSLVDLLLEIRDPFAMTKGDIAPLLEEIRRRDLVLERDLVGRIYFSYMKDGGFVHGISLGLPVEE